MIKSRSSHQRCSVTKAVLRNFTKFTGKQAEACNFIKKEALAQVFSCEFCEISKNTFSYRTPLVTTSGNIVSLIHGNQDVLFNCYLFFRKYCAIFITTSGWVFLMYITQSFLSLILMKEPSIIFQQNIKVENFLNFIEKRVFIT